MEFSGLGNNFNLFFSFINSDNWRFLRNGITGHIKQHLEMDWQERFETAFVGVLGLIGLWLVKKSKPLYNMAKRVYGLMQELDILKKDVGIVKDRQLKVLYTSSHPVFIVNPKGEVIFVNPAWLEMTGIRTEKDAFGFGFLKVIPEKNREAMIEQNELLSKHPSAFEGEVEFQNLITDEIILTICRSEPVFYNGEHIETIGILTIIK